MENRKKVPPFKRAIDVAIQVFFMIGFLYAAYQLFFVFKNPIGGLVLFGDASGIDHQLLVVRRLYALEFWLIFIGYMIYIAAKDKILRL